MDKEMFVQFRNDGKVRVFTNKRPPVTQGVVVVLTDELRRKMIDKNGRPIPFNRWRFDVEKKEVYAAEPPVSMAAVLLHEEDPIQAINTPSRVEYVEKVVFPWKYVAAAAAGGSLVGYLLKLLADVF